MTTQSRGVVFFPPHASLLTESKRAIKRRSSGPAANPNVFSDVLNYRGERVGDIGWSLWKNIKLYLVTPNPHRWVYEFDPAEYNSNVERRADGDVYTRDHEQAKKTATSLFHFRSYKKPSKY